MPSSLFASLGKPWLIIESVWQTHDEDDDDDDDDNDDNWKLQNSLIKTLLIKMLERFEKHQSLGQDKILLHRH